MPLIPNKLHFIWVGKPIPAKYAENIIFWISTNPNYEVTLWTHERMIQTNMFELVQAYKRKGHYIDEVNTKLAETDYGLSVTLIKDGLKLVSFNVSRIESLVPLTDPGILFEELTTWENYGAASDILRMWVLHQFGGIYMDTDTYSTGASIPCNISAPYGFLIHSLVLDGKPSTCSALMASERESYMIRDMARRFDENYSKEYNLEHTGVIGITPFHDSRLKAVRVSREVLADPTRSVEDKQLAAQLFRDAFTLATIYRSGGTLDKPDEGLDIVSFEVQSGYRAIIKSEGAWRQEEKRKATTVYDPRTHT